MSVGPRSPTSTGPRTVSTTATAPPLRFARYALGAPELRATAGHPSDRGAARPNLSQHDPQFRVDDHRDPPGRGIRLERPGQRRATRRKRSLPWPAGLRRPRTALPACPQTGYRSAVRITRTGTRNIRTTDD